MRKVFFLILAFNCTLLCQSPFDYCELKNIKNFFLDLTYDGSSEKLLKYFVKKEYIKTTIKDNTGLLNVENNYDCSIWLEFLIHESEITNQFFGRVELRIYRRIIIPNTDCKDYQNCVVYYRNKHILINPNDYNDNLENYFKEISIDLIKQFSNDYMKSNY